MKNQVSTPAISHDLSATVPLISSKFECGAMLCLVLLASALRWPGLGSVLDGDEATTFLMHSQASWPSLFFEYLGPNQHTLFSALSNGVMGIFGESERAFRFPAWLAGVLSVPLTFALGSRLTGSTTTGWAAAVLMAFAVPDIMWSQLGRGYSLTACLGLLVLFCALKVEECSPNRVWQGGLVISGLAMVLTLPSNVYFLVGCALAFLLRFHRTLSLKQRLKDAIPWLFLFALILVYFLLNFSDLKRGIEIYREYIRLFKGVESLAFSWNRASAMLENLVSPWGLWVYLLVLTGWKALKGETACRLLFIFAVPTAVAWASEMLGPPRAYIYWLPLVMILAANGIVSIGRSLTAWVTFPRTPMAVTVLVVGGMLWAPVIHLNDYYSSRSEGKPLAAISEAMQVRDYIKTEMASHQMLVFPFADRVLRTYIEEQVAEKMRRIFTEERLDGLLFVGHKDTAPKDIPRLGIFPPAPFLHDSSFKVIREIGDLRVYEFDLKPVPLFAPGNAADVLARFDLSSRADLTVGKVTSRWGAGRQALIFRKSSPGPLLLQSSQAKRLKNEGGEAYVLLLFARKFDQKSEAGILRIGQGVAKLE
ncbi:MAG: glycosyltransferase family 39 protein, partial [Nitrospinae bacterium]|nr:glycosyltransferase family 39 protein [Nitrospinota bacterium]